MLDRARRELGRGEVGAAARTLVSVLALVPGNPEVIRCRGLVAQRQGDYATVIDCYRQVVDVWPEDADLHLGLGAALFAAGEIDAGIDHLQRACGLAPDSAAAWLNLGEALQQAARGRVAIDALARAARLDPASVPIRLSLARAVAATGDGEASARAYCEVLHREPANPAAWFGLSQLNAHRFDPTDVECLQGYLASATAGTPAHELLGFALGKALEDQGEYAAAFEAFRAVNDLRHARLHWDAAGERRHVQAIRSAFTEWAPPGGVSPGAGSEIIFIASIPRSGSSLVEQILASHPEVEGANEVQAMPDLVDQESRRLQREFPAWVRDATAGDWQRLGAAYLGRTARWRARKPRSTDKNLANWYLAGAALAMLPAARVVVVRRDPLETCLACYRQWLGGDAGFSCDLGAMSDYCIDFIQLTRFWLERFPGRVFDLEYETLVADPESTVRSLLGFCGLGFDPACIAFHRNDRPVLSAPSAVQVRQPLRRDTARAERYGDKLDLVRAKLREADLPRPHPRPGCGQAFADAARNTPLHQAGHA